MSISVKNISISIDGIKSNEFDIELEGTMWHLDNFSLFQSLLAPNSLSFTMHKDPEEDDIRENIFNICGQIIGKEITLLLHTEIITPHEPGDKSDTIAYKGVILSASGSRCRSEYYINVITGTWESLLNDNPSCKSFENMTLNDIVNDIIEDYTDHLDSEVDSRYTETIPYCVQYNETNYQFLLRLARRYGEWIYNTGEKFVFGNLPQGEMVKLAYPSQDIPSYNIDLKMQHVAFNHVASSYNSYDANQKEGLEEMQREYNTLSERVFLASQENFTKQTLQNLHSGGYADSDGRETILNISTKTQARGEKASMLTYSGNTYCSKLKIGGTLVIEDNYIVNGITNEKSPVDQDEILITSISHHFSKDKVYSNSFTGIPAACDYPPYADSDVFPVAASCRAKVTDNEDPNNLGRIRVQFDWQAQLDDAMVAYGTALC